MDGIPTLPNPIRRTRRFRGQGVVEFALVLPVLLLVIFMIIELARVLHAYLVIENGARYGVRYAVTGEYNDVYCVDGGDTGSTACDGAGAQSEKDAARLPSIEDVARAGSSSILRDESLVPGQPGFFTITVCSSRSGYAWFPSDQATFTPAECVPTEDAGAPGDRVSVTIDFEHPLITPILSSFWPQLHLVAKREGIIEQFRTARVVGLPATISGPTWTPTDTFTPSQTFTPSDTPTPTETASPTITDTPTASPTITYTPSRTPTPSCALLYSSAGLYRDSSDRIAIDVTNDNVASLTLLSFNLSWTVLPSDPPMYADYSGYGATEIWNGTDYTSPTSGSTSVAHAGGSTMTWYMDYDDQPVGGIRGTWTVTLSFTNGCSISDSYTMSTVTPSRTPTRTQTPTRTATGPTPTRTRTPTASRTPTRTRTPTPGGATNTPVPPTNTPTSGPASPTNTRTPSRTPTNTSSAPTFTNTPSKTPTSPAGG